MDPDLITSFDLVREWPVVLVAVSGLVLVVTAMVVLLSTGRPRAPLATLVGATAGLQNTQVGGVHAFCVAVALWLVFGVFWRPRGGPARPGAAILIILAAAPLAGTVLIGEMVNNAPTGVQLMLLAGTAGVVAAFAERADLRPFMVGLLAVTSLACVVAVGQYAGVVPYKVFMGTRRPIGIYGEPDWLGMFSGVGLFLAYRLRTGRWRYPLVVLHAVVLVLAAARAAWLAVAVVAVVGAVAVRLSGRRDSEWVGTSATRRRTVALALVLGAAGLLASPSLRDSLVDRVGGVSVSRPDVSAQARQQQNASLLHLESEAPLTGLGLSASGRVGVSGRITYLGRARNNVASNWLLGWWVDGGVLAVPAILLFLIAMGRRLNTTVGMVLAVVLISSLFSNATLMPISWFLVALCFAPTVLRPARSPGGAGAARETNEMSATGRIAARV
jgi:hypothetical protein